MSNEEENESNLCKPLFFKYITFFIIFIKFNIKLLQSVNSVKTGRIELEYVRKRFIPKSLAT
jgi:hypothetical protein